MSHRWPTRQPPIYGYTLPRVTCQSYCRHHFDAARQACFRVPLPICASSLPPHLPSPSSARSQCRPPRIPAAVDAALNARRSSARLFYPLKATPVPRSRSRSSVLSVQPLSCPPPTLTQHHHHQLLQPPTFPTSLFPSNPPSCLTPHPSSSHSTPRRSCHRNSPARQSGFTRARHHSVLAPRSDQYRYHPHAVLSPSTLSPLCVAPLTGSRLPTVRLIIHPLLPLSYLPPPHYCWLIVDPSFRNSRSR